MLDLLGRLRVRIIVCFRTRHLQPTDPFPERTWQPSIFIQVTEAAKWSQDINLYNIQRHLVVCWRRLRQSGFKVEYQSILCDTAELRFSIQIWIVGEKVGEGIGRTRKEAQRQAAYISLRNLADKFLSFDPDKLTVLKDNGFSSNPTSFKYTGSSRDDMLPVASTSDVSRYMHERVYNSTKSASSVAALKELCTAEGYNLVFQAQPSASDNSTGREVHAQIEIDGKILGKGVGTTWEEAKLQAADGALRTLKYMLGQLAQKRSGSPRSFASNFSKRFKPDFQPTVQRIPPGRYYRSDSYVP